MKPRIRETIEIIGMFSIVASLLFVGLQLQLDRNIAIGAQFHERSVLFHDGIIALYENDADVSDIAAAWDSGRLPGWWNEDIAAYQQERGIHMEGLYRLYRSTQLTWIRLNNNYFQYQQGFINEDTWKEQLLSIRANLTSPIGQAVALSMNTLEPGFRLIIREMIEVVNDEA